MMDEVRFNSERSHIRTALGVIALAGCIGITAAIMVRSTGSANPRNADGVILQVQADESPETPEKSGATAPPLILVSPLLDMGYLEPEGFGQGTMTLMNDSDKTLHLIKADGDCECTIPLIQNMILEPGESTDMLVELNAPHNLGRIVKRIFITAEGYDAAFEVGFTAEIGYPIKINGGENHSLIVETSGTYTLDSIDGKPFRLLAVNGVEPTSHDYVGFDPAADEPRAHYEIRFDYSDTEPERLPRWIVLETDRPGAEMFEFPAYLPGYTKLPKSSKWWARKDVILMGQIRAAEWIPTSIIIAGNMPTAGDAINMISSNADIALEITGIRRPDHGPGMRIDFRAKTRWGYEGFLGASITVEMGDNFLVVDIFARVKPLPIDGADKIVPDLLTPK